MATFETYRALLGNVDESQLKVSYSRKPFILLCGGPAPEKLHLHDKEPETESLRHAVNKQALSEINTSFHLFRPEEIPEWATDAIFKNLMDFERELAAVCSRVLIILESAGAIAELGAFSQLVELNKKLIVIRNEFHGEENSFIDLGILRYIRADHGQNKIKNYLWTPKSEESELKVDDQLASDILHDLKEEVEGLKKSSKFKKTYDTHIAALICELTEIFTLIRETEIRALLNSLNIPVEPDMLKRKLYILKNFSLIDNVSSGSYTYYYRTSEPFHTVNGLHNENGAIDKLRIAALIKEKIQEDRHRTRALNKLGGIK
ncbi:MAG: hypothetical protein CMI08_13265 [Oceanospirillaceae bacterium]|uniref:retron St85 family effector protein n=1 Tax=Thalassolituus sp. UBA1505 TaxID=1947653 RepID=UPI000C556E45|nr:retron St85 family effector protein [Thalassolituus sp. UBA1505]MAS24814.1 hypothetical protein [Oceanospirillaceae bacterium]MAY00142.1 hypothetical protein [Oceanospirillaceae bacterium]MBS52278.1 hypothetical protein [Oceanospirillaceae bacterium]